MISKTMRKSLWLLPVLVSLFGLSSLYDNAFAQEVIDVNQTSPCFLNYSAGPDMWENCGADEDYIQFALLPWQWITGGWFSMIIVSIFIFFSYIKYHKAMYPILIGIIFLPISYYFFPEQFVNWAAVMAAFAIAAIIFKIFTRQTKEY